MTFNLAWTVVRPLFLPVIILFMSACGPAVQRSEPTNLVWPLPPNPPKILYVQSIYSEDDIGRAYSFKEMLFGKDYRDAMSRPYGVSARQDKLYVTDLTLRSVFIFDLAAKRISILGAEGALQVPSAVAADATGTVYAADVNGEKVAVYDANGAYRTAYPVEGCKPVSLGLNDTLARLYVVDRAGHRVITLGLDGKKLFEFGAPGSADGQFNLPIGVAVDKKGFVYVLDSGNFRVQIFDADGKFISKFGSVGDRPGMFANPKGIAVDSENHIYVTDAAFSNFQVFDNEGHILLFVGTLGPAPGQLHLPGGIAIDEKDRIFVADQFNKRIQVFQYLRTP